MTRRLCREDGFDLNDQTKMRIPRTCNDPSQKSARVRAPTDKAKRRAANHPARIRGLRLVFAARLANNSVAPSGLYANKLPILKAVKAISFWALAA